MGFVARAALADAPALPPPAGSTPRAEPDAAPAEGDGGREAKDGASDAPSLATDAPPPPGPFPHEAEYRPPVATEIGTAAGQFRAIGSLGPALGRGGMQGAALGTLEQMTFAWLGVRGSTLVTVPFTGGAQLVSWRVGPSLHLIPYRRVDLGAYVDGGLALVDITKTRRAVMPAVAVGGTIDVSLTSMFFLHFEGLVHTGIASREGVATTHLHPIGVAGLGIAL